jgi:hypothetical protein
VPPSSVNIDRDKNKSGVLLSQLFTQFPARLGRPPEPRYKAGPYDADSDGGGAMESDIDDRMFELSRVIPVDVPFESSAHHEYRSL